MIKYKTLKIGDVFYESVNGIDFEMVVVAAPEVVDHFEDRPIWSWKAQNVDGGIQRYVVTEGLECYGPSLYDFRGAYSFPKG